MNIIAWIAVYVLLGLVLMPGICIDAAINGINLCLSVIIPSLFPFFICSKIFVKSGFAEKISRPFRLLMRPLFNVPECGAFAFIIGIISGCPAGACVVSDMYERSSCTHAEAQRMLCFCNNSGPLFIIGSVAAGMLGFKEIGFTLYISHLLSAIIVGLVFARYKRREVIKCVLSNETESASDIVGESMRESVALTGYVCGFVIFFAVIIEILKQSGITEAISQRTYGGVINGLIYGLCEMTNGISCIANAPLGIVPLCAVSFVIGFGGLSVMLQVYGIIKKHNLSIGIFFVAKVLQGLISSFITYLIVQFSNITLPVFVTKGSFGILNLWAFSINVFVIFGIIIFFLSTLYVVCKILR